MYTKIADYGLIGNCRSSALVSKWGSIDWACLPDFDSDAYFCKILDNKKGGYFDIHPTGFYQSSQAYKKNTNILKTDFFSHSGRVLLTDFMPLSKIQEENNSIPENGLKFIRRVKAKLGNHTIRVEIKVSPNYGKSTPNIVIDNEQVVFVTETKRLVVHAPKSVFKLDKNLVTCEFNLKENDERFFVVGLFDREQNDIGAFDSLNTLYQQTLDFWLWWVSLSRYNGVFKDQVIRSALTLKLLIFNPTGAVIAAPTTSLPEKLGGNLNWDYRYVWLRDASFTMYALLGLGYLKEAMEFMEWLEKVCLSENQEIQIMYGLHGEKVLSETELHNLSGYENSKPVRLGNAAYSQRQIDVYGEVLSCLSLYVDSGGDLKTEMKDFVIKLVDLCIQNWQEKDAGIWEGRGENKHHTYSKLTCWLGIDRGISLAKKLNIAVDLNSWEKARGEIKDDILRNGFDKDLSSFVDFYGGKVIDSSNLNIPLFGFLPSDDPRVLSTLDITLSRLSHDWFIYRSSNQADKLKVGEGTFFLSTFWLIDNLSIQGRTKEAKIWLEKMIHHATPLGLYGEMFDPTTKDHLGNFPQAFTHLGLINSVLNLNKSLRYGSEITSINPSERLSQISNLVNKQFEKGLELLIPSAIRNGLLERERRRTKKHSLFGSLLKKS